MDFFFFLSTSFIIYKFWDKNKNGGEKNKKSKPAHEMFLMSNWKPAAQIFCFTKMFCFFSPRSQQSDFLGNRDKS